MPKPRWLEIAEAEIGIHETPGPASTARILEYHAATTLRATSDAVPWCSSFVCWVLRQAGIEPTGSAAAASWLRWGDACYPPRPGAVCVIRRKRAGADPATGSASGFHVGFWMRATPERVWLLGGNQADQVKVTSFRLQGYAVLAYRWPRFRQ